MAIYRHVEITQVREFPFFQSTTIFLLCQIMFFYKKLTVDIYTTKATCLRREFCKKQLFLYTLYYFIAILYLLEMPEQAVISLNSISLC